MQSEVEEVLPAIYGDDFTPLEATKPYKYCFSIRVSPRLLLVFRIPQQYSSASKPAPAVAVRTDRLTQSDVQLEAFAKSQLASLRSSRASDEPIIFELVSAVQEWLASPPSPQQQASSSSSTSETGAVGSAASQPQSQGIPGSLNSQPLESGSTVASAPSPDSANAPPNPTQTRWWEIQDADFSAAITEASAAAADHTVSDVSLQSMGGPEHGTWNYVIGFVGKPSSGKSTLFNASAKLIDSVGPNDPVHTIGKSAKMAAHPFTTITPNNSPGAVAVQCMCESLKRAGARSLSCYAEQIGAANGGAPPGMRYIPVSFTDVAGLVPGAYKGRGRGNQFLNDVRRADVLIHVVDSSGETDSEGRFSPDAEGDPVKDIAWVREELHLWIFQNVCAKWSAIVRKPQKLMDMFSGYDADRAMVNYSLQRAGVNTHLMQLNGLPITEWTASHLHSIVAHFLRVRFPILVALNKCDRPSSAANIARVKVAYPHERCEEVCALADLLIANLKARLTTTGSTPNASVNRLALAAATASGIPEGPKQLEEVHRLVRIFCPQLMTVLGITQPTSPTTSATATSTIPATAPLSTGVGKALTAAISLRPPCVAYPICDFETFAPIGCDPVSAATLTAPGLRECVVMRQGCTVGMLFDTVKFLGLVDGEYVYAESAVTSTAETKSVAPTKVEIRVMKKDDHIGGPDSSVIRILGTRNLTRKLVSRS
ncbi:GTPase C-terminal family protein [Pelomyxa schiedti]|nr:GTPase C-terminal family protein [Pelomyxa schiedti]